MGILALDVGTSSVKAAVLDQATGAPVSEPPPIKYPLLQPEPDAAVISPEAIWQAILEAGRAAVDQQSVEGVGLSVFSPGWLFLDKNHKPITPVITHLDRRARPTARELRRSAGDWFLKLNGNPILPGGISGVGACHLLKMDPDLRNRVKHFWHLISWVAWKLTGDPAMDPGNAAFTGLFAAIQDQTWSSALSEWLGLPLEWLPPIRDGRSTLGGLSTESAVALGLRSGTPVKLGVADTSSAVLAARLKPNEMLHVVGTTQVLTFLTNRPAPDERRLTRPLGVDTWFMQVTHNPVGGVALDWLHELCFRDQTSDQFFSKTIATAKQRAPGVVHLDPPYLGGDRLELEPRSAGFQGLTLTTDRLDLLAALLAGMRDGHQRALLELGLPAPPTRIVVTGGGADVVRNLIPAYAGDNVDWLPQASLRGVARLFD